MAGAAAQLVPRTAFLEPPTVSSAAAPARAFPPINFIYGHFHNSIRAELGLLAERVRSLEAPGEGVGEMLADLRERYKFLEQVYKYHSTVEDEVRRASAACAYIQGRCARCTRSSAGLCTRRFSTRCWTPKCATSRSHIASNTRMR